MSRRKFFETSVVATVLSEDVPPEFDNLAELHHMISEGDCVGVHEVTRQTRLNGRQVAKRLYDMGSEPGFFQLDDHGNDVPLGDEPDAQEPAAAEPVASGDKIAYNSRLTADEQVSAEEEIAFYIHEYLRGMEEINKENAAEAGRDILYMTLRRFRPDLFEDAQEDKISITWTVSDVQAVRPDLTDEQAMDVLDRVEHEHDATLGVNWETLENAAEALYAGGLRQAIRDYAGKLLADDQKDWLVEIFGTSAPSEVREKLETLPNQRLLDIYNDYIDDEVDEEEDEGGPD